MRDLIALERCEVLVLVDNVSDILSTVPPGVTGEVANVLAAGASELHGRCLCCAQWGLSLAIRCIGDQHEATILFDSGPEAYGLERNAHRLGFDFSQVDEAVFSHGHWDHVGGMTAALKRITSANGGRPVAVHANEGMFVQRAMRMQDRIVRFADLPSRDELEAAGGRLNLDPDQRLLAGGLACLSGEILRITAYEKGLPPHLRRGEDDEWEPDPLIMDERFLAVNVRNKGIIVFSSCSHAGIINVLSHARDIFSPTPLWGVVGGFHLSGPGMEEIIEQTVGDMQRFDLQMFVPGHCTGWRAVHRLVDAFGDDRVVPSAVGRRHVFAA